MWLWPSLLGRACGSIRCATILVSGQMFGLLCMFLEISGAVVRPVPVQPMQLSTGVTMLGRRTNLTKWRVPLWPGVLDGTVTELT